MNFWPSFHFFDTNPPGGIFTDTMAGTYEIRLNYSFGWFVRARKDTNDKVTIALTRLIAFGPTGMIISEPGDSIIAVGGLYGWDPDSSVLRTAFSSQGCAIENIQGDINKEFKGTLLIKRSGKYYWSDLRRAKTDPSGILQNSQLQFNTESLPEGTALDKESPATATNFRVEGNTLKWNNPTADFARVILRSSTTGYPDINGEFVYSGTQSGWVVNPSVTTYFGLWVLDEFSNLSSPVFTQNSIAVEEDSYSTCCISVQSSQNPIRQQTTISFQISAESYVSLKLYDSAGRCVKTLINSETSTGQYAVRLDSQGMSNGIYFCRLEVGKNIITKKLILLQ